MLRTANEQYGNCELGLILDASRSLLPTLAGDPLDPAALGTHLTEPPTRRKDEPASQLLRILAEAEWVKAYLADTRAAANDARFATSTVSVPMRPGQVEPGVLTLVANVTVTPGALCSVQLADGTLLGPVRATDPVAVCSRPGAGSPLENESLARVLGHPRLSNQLFEALEELAQVRPDAAPGTGARTGARTSWRASAERVVGPALVTLALGSRRTAADHGDGDSGETVSDVPVGGETGLSAGDAADETDEDDDVGTWDGDDVDTGIDDPWDVTSDPVSLLLSDAVTARRMARMIKSRGAEADAWELPALLALLRVSLLVAAGGGWEDTVWPTAVADLLESLKLTKSDVELEPSRLAAAVVGLAALAAQIDDWAIPSDLRTWFEEIHGVLALDADGLDARLVTHYAADLYLGLGPQLTTEAVLDAAPFLIAGDPLARVAEGLAVHYPGIRIAAPRLLELKAAGTPQTIVLRLLSQCGTYAPIAVRLLTTDGELFAAWRPKHLLLQHQRKVARGAEYRLPIGPGAYATQSLPTPFRSWAGAMPAELRNELIDGGMLDC